MKKTKSMCSGCRHDFYNGHNNIGVKECWSFKSAKVVKRQRVGTWQPPPYTYNPEECLNCYSPSAYSMLELTDPRIVKQKK